MCIMSAHYVAQKSTPCLSYRVHIVGDSDVLPCNEFLARVHVCDVSWFLRADMETFETKRDGRSTLCAQGVGILYLVSLNELRIFLNPRLFASCTDTFCKWCKITRGVKKSAQ
jgi:hypothetical protein